MSLESQTLKPHEVDKRATSVLSSFSATSDKFEPQAERKPDALLGGGILNQYDSDTVRAGSTAKLSAATKALFDPPGHEFSLGNADDVPHIHEPQPLFPEMPEKQTAELISPAGSTTSSENGGSQRKLNREDGTEEILSFNQNGKLISETDNAEGGIATITNYDPKNGIAISRQVKTPDGKIQNVSVPLGTKATQHTGAQGTNILQISEAGRLTGFAFDKQNNITQAFTVDGGKQSWTNYGPTGAPTDVHESITGPGQTSTMTITDGHKTVLTTHDNSREFEETVTNQKDPTFGKLEYAEDFRAKYQRTDHIIGHADGSRDVTTNFLNEPDHTYQTHVDPDGTFTTYREDNHTHEKLLYEKGKQTSRV